MEGGHLIKDVQHVISLVMSPVDLASTLSNGHFNLNKLVAIK